MFLLRSFIIGLAVIAAVKGLALPEPVKGPTKFSNLAESLQINVGLSMKHLPNTDKIVSVWIEGTGQQEATAKGAILSTNGEVNTTFTVSDADVFAFYTPAVIIPRTTTSFSVITASSSEGGYHMRNFDTAGQLLSGPFYIEERKVCFYSNGVVQESSGDVFFVCTFSEAVESVTEFFLRVHRINATGYVLDTATFQTQFENSKPTVALSGNAVAISTAILDLVQSVAVLQVFRADADNLSNSDTFFPYSEFSLTLAHQVIADPLNADTFVLVASSGLVADGNLFPFIVGIRFDRENSSIAETFVSFSGLAISISAAVNEEGQGVLYVVTATASSHIIYPIQINDNETVIELDTAVFDSIRTVSDAEKAVETWKDVRTASTTWSTGSALVWFEISDTSIFSVVSKIYGTYCGDNFVEGAEVCDGGANCNDDCTCPMGVLPDGKNGCGSSTPLGAPSASAPTVPAARPISVGPVAAPSSQTSAAHNMNGMAFLALFFTATASVL